MISENFAERLFCDLKNSEIKIEKPKYVEGGAKIGNIPDSKQFTVFGVQAGKEFRYKFGHSVALSIDDAGQTFTEAYTELLEAVKQMKHVKFYSLVIPNRAVVETKLEEFDKVVSRYLKDYLPVTDELAERWDILVQEIKNA